MQDPPFTIGIEEEYLLVDPATGDLAEAPEALMASCRDALGDQVSPEFLQCQIEVGTGVCASVHEAREDLTRLRRTIAEHAADHGLAPIAAACHPFSDWKDQEFTEKERYQELARDLRGVARRMLACGMHVHIGIPDQDMRIDLVNQLAYFLPHLLALSASSPFWQGEDTGLASYRLTVFDNMPRTGLPPRLANWGEFRRSVDLLTDLGLIEDASKIWWDLRPSHSFPTIESRICDVTPRMEDALTLAALAQCTARMLWRLSLRNQRWRVYERFLVDENRWRAQRYGVRGDGLIDFGRHSLVPLTELVDEWLELIAEDAEALDCADEIARARKLAAEGTSADRQRAVLEDALTGGAERDEALRRVVTHLAEEFRAGL
ncbi:Carboxylate-amine ligase YbdK [Jannaschia seosinensis]|uniref:Putative glutamate--cysteine ligase 2 n=1 Tax=Jannaschia seosinensis TaxID=313367 RepID=A0A0M7BFF8_9RHOB|nr:carboxylate-amine ligase [Jannaschia seosinensis]CUH40818.1 Carboxylate-amine ligase YbdK [Jannaschia seosinensis]